MALTRAIRPHWLGNISYGSALKIQNAHVAEHKRCAKTENVMLLLEHPPTYTVGKRGQMYDETFEEYLRA